MLRPPAVAGLFYPSDPAELSTLIGTYLERDDSKKLRLVKACLVPHAGYVYSGHVAGAVYGQIEIPKKVIVLGVRHRPPGSPAAIISQGAWHTPLGDARIDEELAKALRAACPQLREDIEAHSKEHSLEVQLPFLQTVRPDVTFVPIALGGVHFEGLVSIGAAIGHVLQTSENVLLVTTSDLNHYEDDRTTRIKDRKAIDELVKMDGMGLYDTCRNEDISMCGLGPAVAMLTALHVLKASKAELVRYATSAERSGDPAAVVGYVGMTFY
jgi:AmmeMemoRadiSam system protein B